ncbi:single-stranded-DNA-specific exonuclease RecJ [bacterium]|nr:single-stranded-DNA-specific exonuclease RecJ [bacterium]
MPRTWRYATHDEPLIRRVAADANVPPLVAQVLIARGYTEPEQLKEFMHAKLTDLHEPLLLPGVDEASDIMISAMKDDRRITIYGDYDVDGVTSTALLWHCLKNLGANVDYYIPSRLEEGYGINCEALRQLHKDDPQRLVVSVDCGIASVAEIEMANEIGLQTIVTDHHTMGDRLPPTTCVHPRLPGGEYPYGDLCGVGVAFKLAWAICQKLGEDGKATPAMRAFLVQAVGLTAIGTVADCVPLTGENRIIVRYGMHSITSRPSPGLRKLIEVSKVSLEEIKSDDIAFSLAPRINATGRLGQARLAVELLTTKDRERIAELAEHLDVLNKQRQAVERRILKQAKDMVEANEDWADDPVLVLAHKDWHPGVIGIVATRVAEAYSRPTVLISLQNGEVGQGSARSFAGFDLYTALKSCDEHLIRCGGHKAAAGLRISPPKLDEFRAAFIAYAAENHSFDDDGEFDLKIDAEVQLNDIKYPAVMQLERLGPFGMENRRPRFASTNVEVVGEPKKMGEGERHLSLQVKQFGRTMRAVAFGRGEWADEIAAVNGPIAISYAPVINTFRGLNRVELHLVDWNAVESNEQVAAG